MNRITLRRGGRPGLLSKLRGTGRSHGRIEPRRQRWRPSLGFTSPGRAGGLSRGSGLRLRSFLPFHQPSPPKWRGLRVRRFCSGPRFRCRLDRRPRRRFDLGVLSRCGRSPVRGWLHRRAGGRGFRVACRSWKRFSHRGAIRRGGRLGFHGGTASQSRRAGIGHHALGSARNRCGSCPSAAVGWDGAAQGALHIGQIGFFVR